MSCLVRLGLRLAAIPFALVPRPLVAKTRDAAATIVFGSDTGEVYVSRTGTHK